MFTYEIFIKTCVRLTTRINQNSFTLQFINYRAYQTWWWFYLWSKLIPFILQCISWILSPPVVQSFELHSTTLQWSYSFFEIPWPSSKPSISGSASKICGSTSLTILRFSSTVDSDWLVEDTGSFFGNVYYYHIGHSNLSLDDLAKFLLRPILP